MYMSNLCMYIYIHIYVCISIFICTPVISFHFCLFSFLISQGKWVNNVIGPQLRAEWFANAWQHLHCDTSHASSELPRSFESPRVCGDGGGVKTLEMRAGTWANVRTTEIWMSFRFGVDRSVWSPSLCASRNGSPCHKSFHQRSEQGNYTCTD